MSLFDDLPKGLKLTSPSGKEFFAVVFRTEGDAVSVLSNKSGKWTNATDMLPDLIMSEQKSDWDITPVHVHDIPQVPKEVFWNEYGR